jgi:SET domain-containing protein
MASIDEAVEVRESPIHGRGVFARKRFRKGAYIATFEGQPTEQDGMHVLWILDDDDREIGIQGRNALRFLNHAAKPNSEFLGPDLHALRNIQPGQEITFHYGEAWDDIE